tara:strand:+ start:446 stop:814 length:369 start_codon:yes stop_codon:yes gene_type:complete
MIKNQITSLFKSLILANSFISIIITIKIFYKNNYNFYEASTGLLIMLLYAGIWFYSLYKIYNFSKFGLRLYITMVFLGFLFNILSNLSFLDKSLYVLTLAEHMIIGSILTFSYFSKLKSKFK